MAVYIELTTEPFDEQFAAKLKGYSSGGTGLTRVRRPLRGIEIKEDTHAYIKLIRVDGREIPIFDSSDPSGTNYAYSNFILQSVQEQRMERHQVVETFGDTYLFLFGESPRFLNITATLLNTLDFNWKAEFMANYEKYLRGTKCVEMGARCYLFYDQNVVEGYILNATVAEQSDNPAIIPLQFQFFVTNSSNISLIGEGSGAYPIREGAFVPQGINLRESLNGELLQELLAETMGPNESSFGRTVERNAPIRGLTSDNTDEYTTPLQPTYDQLLDKRFEDVKKTLDKLLEQLNSLDAALSKGMEGYGVDKKDAQSPGLLEKLGLKPTFVPGGVGIGSAQGEAGALATFGASAAATASASFGAKAGASAFAGAYAGVGASAQAGAYAGASAGASTGASAEASAFAVAQASITGKASASASASASAFASASASAQAQAGASASAYASAQAKAAAQAGGYAGANGYLGFTSKASAETHAGAQGAAGAGVLVGGESSAFALVAASGKLANVGVPPSQALQEGDKKWSWSKNWSWPSAQ